MSGSQIRSLSRMISSGSIVDFGRTGGGIANRLEDYLQTRKSLKLIQGLFPAYSYKLFQEECLVTYN